MRRKNPLTSVERLDVREIRAGDRDAVHALEGITELDGDVDAFVLRVRENAAVERLLLVSRLEVSAAARRGGGRSSPYVDASGGYTSGGYVSASHPSAARDGACIDEDGTLRTGGWIVIGDAERGLVLRSPEGRYFAFTVDERGRLSTTGVDLGTKEP